MKMGSHPSENKDYCGSPDLQRSAHVERAWIAHERPHQTATGLFHQLAQRPAKPKTNRSNNYSIYQKNLSIFHRSLLLYATQTENAAAELKESCKICFKNARLSSGRFADDAGGARPFAFFPREAPPPGVAPSAMGPEHERPRGKRDFDADVLADEWPSLGTTLPACRFRVAGSGERRGRSGRHDNEGKQRKAEAGLRGRFRV